MILWVIEVKPEGANWQFYDIHELEEDARWALDELRNMSDASRGYRLVQYAPVSTKRGQGRKVNK